VFMLPSQKRFYSRCPTLFRSGNPRPAPSFCIAAVCSGDNTAKIGTGRTERTGPVPSWVFRKESNVLFLRRF
jgi:hypothetical protein